MVARLDYTKLGGVLFGWCVWKGVVITGVGDFFLIFFFSFGRGGFSMMFLDEIA